MKRALFDAGSAAFARVFPLYVCPLCLRTFALDAIASKDLTLEHVPPKSSGGKELVLTCKDCNAHSGQNIDDHMMKADRPIAFLRGEHRGGQLAELTLNDGPSISVRLGGGPDKAIILMGKEGVDPPGQHKAFTDALGEIARLGRDGEPPDYRFNIGFKDDRHSADSARVGWLRAGYLAAFARFGYRYVLGPALDVVRRQIREPEAEILPRAFHVLVPTAPRTARRIATLQEPKTIAGITVQFGWHMVLLPQPGDMNYYDRVAKEAVNNPKCHGTGTEYEWPKTATHAADGLVIAAK
jgi:hypothetical protein